jgi:hypothetical protein
MFAAIGAYLAKSALLGSIGSGLKSFFSALSLQGWVGLVVSILLAWQWIHAAGEARHWKKQSGQFEKLYRAEQTAFAHTVANYRAAADKARADDAANKARVEAEQAAINERTAHDYQARIDSARALAERLRANAQAHSGSSGGAPVPGLSAAAGGIAESAANGLSDALQCTEQAIQLDELIAWTKRQHAIDPNKGANP